MKTKVDDRGDVDWELVLSSDHVRSAVQELSGSQEWQAALPELLQDIQLLLRDALDLFAELGGANELEDRSSFDLPSISPHWQNRGFEDWVSLIELLRDAWLAVREKNPGEATRIAQSWFEVPYPTFKRLALFAASHDDSIASNVWVHWLARDQAWWLWSINTQRETLRLLVLKGLRLAKSEGRALEKAILAGPPRDMYKADITDSDWASIRERTVWLRLAKLQSSGRTLGPHAAKKFAALSKKNKEWRLAPNEQDEFWHWMSGTGDPDYEARREIDYAPNTLSKLIQWLKRPEAPKSPWYEDTWSEKCRDRFYLTFSALRHLADEGLWPVERWNEALQAWSDQLQVARSWRFASRTLTKMPQATFAQIGRAVGWWLEAVSKSEISREDDFISLSRRVLDLPWDEPLETSDPVSQAINHPVGLVTQGLLNIWFKRSPNDSEGLPSDLAPVFASLCDSQRRGYVHGRVILASRVIALFRVDRPWTEEFLLPFFSWNRDQNEAAGAWRGFLWSPRLHWPLLATFKTDFLSTALNYEELGDHGRQYAAFITYAALEPGEGYAQEDFRTAIKALPPEGLDEVARTLAQALESAGDRRSQYWKNRVYPFWQNVWPKRRDIASKRSSDALARLAIAASEAFPEAFSTVEGWLGPIEHPHYVIHLLKEAGLAARFPREALAFLATVVKDQTWPDRELRPILKAIGDTSPSLQQDRHFIELDNLLRQRNL